MWTFVSNNKQAHSAKRGGAEPAPTITGGHDSGNRVWIHDGDDEVTWGYRDRPAPTVTGGGGKASGIELFDQQSRKKLLMAIANDEANGNGRVVNPATPLDPIRVTVEEAALLQTFPKTHMAQAGTSSTVLDPRPVGHPAGTITGARTAEWGTRSTRATGSGNPDPDGLHAEVHEVAALQTFEDGFIWAAPYVDDKGRAKTVAKTKQFLIIGNSVPPLLVQAMLEELWSLPAHVPEVVPFPTPAYLAEARDEETVFGLAA